MMKCIVRILILLLLKNGVLCAKEPNDVTFLNGAMITHLVEKGPNNSYVPDVPNAAVSNQDNIFLYYANVGVMNPTKKKYDVELSCIDKKEHVLFRKVFQQTVHASDAPKLGVNTMKEAIITFTMNPKTGGMVPGQTNVLKDHQDYYMKLYFDKKLIGITEFRYYSYNK